MKNDRNAVIIKQEGNVHSLTVNGIKRGDSGSHFSFQLSILDVSLLLLTQANMRAS